MFSTRKICNEKKNIKKFFNTNNAEIVLSTMYIKIDVFFTNKKKWVKYFRKILDRIRITKEPALLGIIVSKLVGSKYFTTGY